MHNETHIDYIPVIEETAQVTTSRVVSGRVRIATRTEEIEQTLPAELSSSEVEVIRVPVDRRIEAIPDVTVDGNLTVIPVVEERLVVMRELYLREEIHVRRIERKETVDVPVTTRRQTVQIDRFSPEGIIGDPAQPSKDDHDDL